MKYSLYNVIWAGIGGGLFVAMFVLVFFHPLSKYSVNNVKIPEYFNGIVTETNFKTWGEDFYWGGKWHYKGEFSEGYVVVKRNSDGWKRKFVVNEEQSMNLVKDAAVSINLDTGEMELWGKKPEAARTINYQPIDRSAACNWYWETSDYGR